MNWPIPALWLALGVAGGVIVLAAALVAWRRRRWLRNQSVVAPDSAWTTVSLAPQGHGPLESRFPKRRSRY
jgi:hypothetical protein